MKLCRANEGDPRFPSPLRGRHWDETAWLSRICSVFGNTTSTIVAKHICACDNPYLWARPTGRGEVSLFVAIAVRVPPLHGVLLLVPINLVSIMVPLAAQDYRYGKDG